MSQASEDRIMLDPIVIPTLYFVSVVQLVLQALVFVYAYKVTRITGSFQAWTLIIAAFAILTVRNVVSLLLTLTLPAEQVGTLIESVGVTTTIVSSIVNLAAGVALFLGFFGLAQRFQNQAKSK
ncbi:MAG: hypothetical protein AUF79_04965 [Crenarchaeota archaeon 13_1_20CM_2_51_8]|nr:MAG: hypothetical protein AUF79_04965 [Crenarchaeota archaeon 13_1_20CM_2_51_8]